MRRGLPRTTTAAWCHSLELVRFCDCLAGRVLPLCHRFGWQSMVTIWYLNRAPVYFYACKSACVELWLCTCVMLLAKLTDAACWCTVWAIAGACSAARPGIRHVAPERAISSGAAARSLFLSAPRRTSCSREPGIEDDSRHCSLPLSRCHCSGDYPYGPERHLDHPRAPEGPSQLPRH